jgi:hypothetical protein
MGSPASPAAACIYTNDFETKALQEARLRPRVWKRYVDDILVVCSHGMEELQNSLIFLNERKSNIKFTIEVEKNRKLPFLDILLTRNANGKIGHSVYRKATHTNRYLHGDSHHHPTQINSVIDTLVHRAFTLSDEESRNSEIRLLKSVLVSNCYNSKM